MKAMRHSRRRLGGGKSVLRDFSATRNSLRGGRHGFTLLEILLALGLMALMAAVLVGGSAQLFNDKAVSADDVFWKAVTAARKRALLSGREVRIAFVDDRDHGKRFTIGEGADLQAFPITAASPQLEVLFLPAQKVAGSAMILAGQVVETQPLKEVLFYGDGTCTPFRVQMRVGVDTHLHHIDPWTCAPVLVAQDTFGR